LKDICFRVSVRAQAALQARPPSKWTSFEASASYHWRIWVVKRLFRTSQTFPARKRRNFPDLANAGALGPPPSYGDPCDIIRKTLRLAIHIALSPEQAGTVAGSTSAIQAPHTLRATIGDYIALMKPKIILLLLVTALGAMFLAAQGAPPSGTIALVLIGGSLASGGANALNHYLDRDIDQMMGRTRRRPLPGRRVEPWQALLFGVALNAIAFAMLASGVNLLSAILTLSATLFYVFIYTSWLKRSTTQNIVIGGAAGAIPPMVGWAAVTGSLSLEPWYLFAIVFFWTPPHFWALALMIKDDYEQAGVPMLPVVRGVKETAWSILLHAITLVTITILFVILDDVGAVYGGAAIALGAIFLAMSLRLLRTLSLVDAKRLYLFSLLYLALLFLFIGIEGAV
jgi:protoheme IX farnesyltransferase